MISKIINIYKTQIILSLTVAITIIALNVVTNVTELSLILIGALLGTFLLDLDYIIYAYFVEPENKNSKNIKNYLKDKDFGTLITYFKEIKYSIKDKTLNSALFQVALGIALFLVSSMQTSILLKTLLMSAFINSVFRLSEFYFEKKLDDWFWAFKNTPDKKQFTSYVVIMLTIAFVSLIRI